MAGANTTAPAQAGAVAASGGEVLRLAELGQVLGQHAEGPGVVVCEMDATRLQQVRRQLPALEHRKL